MVLACSLAKILPAASIVWLARNKRFKYCAPTYVTSCAALYTPRQFQRPQTLAIQIHIWSFVRWYLTPNSYASWTLLLGLWAPARTIQCIKKNRLLLLCFWEPEASTLEYGEIHCPIKDDETWSTYVQQTQFCVLTSWCILGRASSGTEGIGAGDNYMPGRSEGGIMSSPMWVRIDKDICKLVKQTWLDDGCRWKPKP